MNNERRGGKAYEVGCSEKDRLCCLWKKNWFIQAPLAEKTFSWIRKNFQQRECSNGKFQRKSFVYQFALAFLQTKGMGFFSQGLGRGGGGYKDTPGSPRYSLPHISVFQAFRSWGRRKDIWAEQKTSEAFIISFIVIFFILLLYGCVTALVSALCVFVFFSFVSGLRKLGNF